MRLHHVQVACPPGGEDAVRRFYGDALGLTEVEKPEPLRPRGGVWFRVHDDAGDVTAELHVGVEDPFAPARTAHPAFHVGTAADLEAVAARIEAAGGGIDRGQRDTFPGHLRLHTRDPHGNRVELLARP